MGLQWNLCIPSQIVLLSKTNYGGPKGISLASLLIDKLDVDPVDRSQTL